MSLDFETPPDLSKHLLGIEGTTREQLELILELTDRFAEIGKRPIPKVPALRGRTVASVFFEDSTRTRLSFESAARRLSADTLTFSAGSSSLSKGESLRDTVEVISSYGADVLIVRHGMAGTPQRVSEWTDASVVNAGDGCHEHPTQALLDCYTLKQQRGALDGMSIGIVGDIRHSRVARSNVLAFSSLGAKVTLIAPQTLMPSSIVDKKGYGHTDIDKKVESVCPYCGVGCQIEYNIKDNRIAYVNGIDGPANKNRLCVKGRFGFDYVSHPERLTKPLIRIEGKKKELHPE